MISTQWRFLSGLRVTLHNERGVSKCWDTSVNKLQDHGDWPWVTIRVVVESGSCQPVSPGEKVKLFRDTEYRGLIAEFPVGSHNFTDDFHSMEIPSGLRVTLHNERGISKCWDTSVNKLQDHGDWPWVTDQSGR